MFEEEALGNDSINYPSQPLSSSHAQQSNLENQQQLSLIDQTISDLTRAKLARELILPLNHHRRRRGPCLRKLVLWSNLLTTSDSAVVLSSDFDSLDQPYQPPNNNFLSVHQNHLEIHHHHQDATSISHPAPPDDSTREQAEYDWFEHLMEEIDDSDSESESSDSTPPDHNNHSSCQSDQKQQHLSQPTLLIKISEENNIYSPSQSDRCSNRVHHSEQSRSQSCCPLKRRRSLNQDEPEYLCRSPQIIILRACHPHRRRQLFASFRSRQHSQKNHYLSSGRRRKTRRRSRHSLRPSISLLPYCGFRSTRVRFVPNSLSSSSPPLRSEPDDEHHQKGLPSLLSIKTTYRFEPIELTSKRATNKPNFSPHLASPEDEGCGDSSMTENLQLNKIDFRPYDFLISATDEERQMQVKYLVGNSTLPSLSNPILQNSIMIQVGHQVRRNSKEMIVKKLCLVLNELPVDYQHPLDSLSTFDNLELGEVHKTCFKKTAQLWKIYGLNQSFFI